MTAGLLPLKVSGKTVLTYKVTTTQKKNDVKKEQPRTPVEAQGKARAKRECRDSSPSLPLIKTRLKPKT